MIWVIKSSALRSTAGIRNKAQPAALASARLSRSKDQVRHLVQHARGIAPAQFCGVCHAS